jgi:peroxiredoxin
VSWDIVSNRGVIINDEELEPVFNSLAEEIRNTPDGKSLNERIQIAKRTKPGSPAIGYTGLDSSGRKVSLDEFKGKFVLLEFWASWCGPCRAENPNLVRVFNKLKDKNFEILSVSLDSNREKWLKAIVEDKLPWVHVSDFDSFISKAYGIRAIPQNVLVSPDGKIMAKNLRGEKLESEVLKYLN